MNTIVSIKQDNKRRFMMKKAFVFVAVAALLLAGSAYAQNEAHCGKCKRSGALNLTDAEYMALADSIHKVAISFDTHIDTPTYTLHPEGHY
ncbi:MAG: hypothetical protein II041_04620, partial [Bacteroidales bacterium]|nr:hypothetical protein [Bacteroidales bacterium]